jgi:hypothetical protein
MDAMIGYELIETPEQMEALPDYSVVVSAVHDVPELGGKVCIATQKIEGGWYGAGMGDIPTDPHMLQNFFPAVLVFQIDQELNE